MVPIGKQQCLSGVEDNEGRKSVKHLGVPRHPRGVEMRLGMDWRISEEISDS
jgi:hypothetical protein